MGLSQLNYVNHHRGTYYFHLDVLFYLVRLLSQTALYDILQTAVLV